MERHLNNLGISFERLIKPQHPVVLVNFYDKSEENLPLVDALSQGDRGRDNEVTLNDLFGQFGLKVFSASYLSFPRGAHGPVPRYDLLLYPSMRNTHKEFVNSLNEFKDFLNNEQLPTLLESVKWTYGYNLIRAQDMLLDQGVSHDESDCIRPQLLKIIGQLINK